MNREIRIVTLTIAALLVPAVLAFAQGRGMSAAGGRSTSAFGGGSGGFGSGGFGSSGFGSGGFGSSGFGSGGFGSSGFGSSGFGSSAFGSSNSGFGGSGGFGGQGSLGGGMGGQNFVGRDSGDMQAIMGQMGRAGTQFFNTMSRNMGNRNRQQQNQNNEENERPPVRIRLEVGFTPPEVAPAVIGTNISTRLARLSRDHSVGQPQVTVVGDTVVLRGVAQSESQRRVLERFVMLEPGVMRVQNEMTVAAATSAVPVPVTGN